MQCDLGEPRSRVEAVTGRERVRSRSVETGAAARTESGIDRIARQRVGEAVPSCAQILDQPGRGRLVERLLQDLGAPS